MLLRQALEQTRTGMPAPVLFNSRLLILDLIDEVSAMVQQDLDASLTLSTIAPASGHSMMTLPGKSGKVSRTARLRPLSREHRHHE